MVRQTPVLFYARGLQLRHQFRKLLLNLLLNFCNFLELLGTLPPYIILEYVPLGKLQSYLRSARAPGADYSNLHSDSNLTSKELFLPPGGEGNGLSLQEGDHSSRPGCEECAPHGGPELQSLRLWFLQGRSYL